MMTYFCWVELVFNWFWHSIAKKKTSAIVANAFAAPALIQMMNCRIIMNRTTKNIINKYDSIVASCKTQATWMHSPSVLLRWVIEDVSVRESISTALVLRYSFIHSFLCNLRFYSDTVWHIQARCARGTRYANCLVNFNNGCDRKKHLQILNAN